MSADALATVIKSHAKALDGKTGPCIDRSHCSRARQAILHVAKPTQRQSWPRRRFPALALSIISLLPLCQFCASAFSVIPQYCLLHHNIIAILIFCRVFFAPLRLSSARGILLILAGPTPQHKAPASQPSHDAVPAVICRRSGLVGLLSFLALSSHRRSVDGCSGEFCSMMLSPPSFLLALSAHAGTSRSSFPTACDLSHLLRSPHSGLLWPFPQRARCRANWSGQKRGLAKGNASTNDVSRFFGKSWLGRRSQLFTHTFAHPSSFLPPSPSPLLPSHIHHIATRRYPMRPRTASSLLNTG